MGAALLLLIIRKYPTPALVLLVLGSYIAGVAIQYAGNYHLFANTRLDTFINIIFVYRNALFFSFPFFCIGFLIHRYNLHQRFSLNRVMIWGAVACLLLLVETYLNYTATNRDGGFDNLLSLLFLCPAIFILFMRMNLLSNTKNIALYATAIYFVHPLFLLPLASHLVEQETLLTLLVLILSIAASYFLIAINKKVKIIL